MARLPLLSPALRWSGVAVAAAAIIAVSLFVVPPETPDTGAVGFDKLWHAATYLAFGLLVAYALVGSDLAIAIKIALLFGIATLFGVGIEVAQSFVPYRQFEVADMVANAGGAALSCGWYGIEPRVQFVGVRGEDGGERSR